MIPALKKPTVRPENATNVIRVPRIPNRRIYPIFSKNLFLLMLNPEAKMMGGKQM